MSPLLRPKPEFGILSGMTLVTADKSEPMEESLLGFAAETDCVRLNLYDLYMTVIHESSVGNLKSVAA